jgi:hypothetical protein
MKAFGECFNGQKLSARCLMTLKTKEEIGMEVHKLDQFFRVKKRPARLRQTTNIPGGKATEYRAVGA